MRKPCVIFPFWYRMHIRKQKQGYNQQHQNLSHDIGYGFRQSCHKNFRPKTNKQTKKRKTQIKIVFLQCQSQSLFVVKFTETDNTLTQILVIRFRIHTISLYFITAGGSSLVWGAITLKLHSNITEGYLSSFVFGSTSTTIFVLNSFFVFMGVSCLKWGFRREEWRNKKHPLQIRFANRLVSLA